MNSILKQSPKMVSTKRSNEIKSKLVTEHKHAKDKNYTWIIKPKYSDAFFSYFDHKKNKRGIVLFQTRQMANDIKKFINQSVEIHNFRSKYKRPYPPLEVRKTNSNCLHEFCAKTNVDYVYFYYDDFMIVHFHLYHE